MKLNIGRIAKTIATKAHENPGIALAVVGLVAPKAAAKLAPVIMAVTRKKL